MSKENFRKLAKKRLKIHASNSAKKDFLIFKEIQKIIQFKKAKNILLFIPLAYEPNLARFRRILSKNCTIFAPFMQDESLKMVKLRLPFEKKAFGVREPKNSQFAAKIDLAVVPVIGVDREFGRIGHGKGFYDRFFARLNDAKKGVQNSTQKGVKESVKKSVKNDANQSVTNSAKKGITMIFVESIEALSSEKLTQAHDIKADFYITPHKKFMKEQRNVSRTSRSYRRYHRRWHRLFSRQENQ